MKPRWKACLFLFAGLLALLSGVVFCRSAAEECTGLNGPHGMDKIVVTATGKMGSQEKALLSPGEVKKLAESLQAGTFTYTANPRIPDTDMGAGGRLCPVHLQGTNGRFPDFTRMEFERGGFFSEEAEEAGLRVVVIEDSLAWKLFNSTDVVGKPVELLGDVFTVMGIYRKDASLLSSLTDDGLPEVYIPMSAMQELAGTAGVSTVQILIPDRERITRDRVRTALYQTGKDPGEYQILDLREVRELLEQKPQLVVFLAGAVSVWILLGYGAGKIKGLFRGFRDACMEWDIREAARRNGKWIGVSVLSAAAALSGAVLLGKAICFKLYIPSEYIPDELIDMGYYMEFIKKSIQNEIMFRTYIAPGVELLAGKALLLSEICFFLSVASGILLMFSGSLYVRLGQTGCYPALVAESIAFSAAIVTLEIVAFGLHMPASMDLKGILVLWTGMYIVTGYYFLRKRKDDVYEKGSMSVAFHSVNTRFRGLQ